MACEMVCCHVGRGGSLCAESYGDEVHSTTRPVAKSTLEVQPVRNCMAMKSVNNLSGCHVGFGASACAEPYGDEVQSTTCPGATSVLQAHLSELESAVATSTLGGEVAELQVDLGSSGEGVPASSVKAVDNSRTHHIQAPSWPRLRRMWPILSPSLSMACCTVSWSPTPNLTHHLSRQQDRDHFHRLRYNAFR